jgi:hypothetical protein
MTSPSEISFGKNLSDFTIRTATISAPSGYVHERPMLFVKGVALKLITLTGVGIDPLLPVEVCCVVGGVVVASSETASVCSNPA